MTLSVRLAELVRAAFAGIWIQSFEHEDALTEISTLCHSEHWKLAVWDIERGLSLANKSDPAATDPLAAIRSVEALAEADSCGILVLVNFHRFLQSTEIIQALAHQITRGKSQGTFICILAPVVQIPVELQKLITVIEHELPDRDQLKAIATSVATEPGEMPQELELEKLLDAAAGLTRLESENAFSLSLLRHGKLTPESIWELKTAALKASGLVTLHQGTESFADLGGLETLKRFCAKALASRHSLARPRGVLLLGPPGTGKSQFAKALGHEAQRPTLVLDVGSLMASYVGQTEANVRQALKIADAMAPAVLFCDEIEKALAGATSSGQTDSGVSARMFGTFLTWLSDHSSQVFVVATCNDIAKLPPEFSRAERFDGIFFIDTPGSSQKQKIWPIYLDRFRIDGKATRPQDRDWSGAEIASCCRLAALLDLSLKEAARNVVPVAVTAAEQLQKLRAWASGRCLDANRGGSYTAGAEEPKTVRRVVRPSAN